MKRSPERLAGSVFDLLLIGGGITGAGAALDAALRGLRVALIDKGDFAGGTSSISSKMVHGGLRYLEHGDVRLVYEALHERRRLLRNAPHLVHPLRFVLPFYAGARLAPWQWRAALLLYDLLAGTGNIHRSRSLPRRRLLAGFPGLRPDNLEGGSEYFDAQMDDARLCIEVLRTAALHGACVVNYVEAIGFEQAGGRIQAVRCRDHLAGRELRIEARQIVNATGPWADAVRWLSGEEGPALLRPTKGVHVVAPDRGLSAAFLLLHPEDGRVFFVFPWLGKTVIGTTDSSYDQSPDAVLVSPADIEYLLAGHNHYFRPALRPQDLLGHFAGLRPLLDASKGAPSARSREFQIVESPAGLMTVGGGKYTTYRHMAEVLVDRVVRRLGRSLRCRTRTFRLDGAPEQPWPTFFPAAQARLRRHYHLPADVARHLVQRYGKRAFDVAGYLERDSTLAERVAAGEPDIRAEFVYQREHEMAHQPADFLLRRTRLGLFRPDLLDNPPELLPALVKQEEKN
jgi:glycerol-3-phosphate dehydrogenase